MGTFKHRVEIGNPDSSYFEEVDTLVDTGATYTWVPRSILERLGHRPSFRRRLRLADGIIIEREGTQLPLRIEDQVLQTICLFGDEGSELLLGAVTLEEFGLGVDPVNQKLVPVVSWLAKEGNRR